jgi:uncharacterized protein
LSFLAGVNESARAGQFHFRCSAPALHATHDRTCFSFASALNRGVPPALTITPRAARRFLLRTLGFDPPFADVASALSRLGYVQIDPINVCGRMHDLILRNRVVNYREGDLMRHLHGAAGNNASPTQASAKHSAVEVSARAAEERIAFEHHHPETHILVAFPLEAWPHLLGAMRARARRTGAWSGRLTPKERELAPQLLAEIAARGPLGSEDFADRRRAQRVVWGAATLVKSTLQKLFFHGRLLIAQRVSQRRRYDLPERVLPARILAQPAAPAAETTRWLALLKLRQRRLATLKRSELAAVADAVQAVTISGCPPLFCLREDAPLLAGMSAEPANSIAASAPVRLLAPLDPLIYDRRVTAALWNFEYTWEAYTPAARRTRGHYALPILAGTELVGHVDPKAEREAGVLAIVSRRIRRGYRVADTLAEFARWLGLRRR